MNRLAYLLIIALSAILCCSAGKKSKDFGPEVTRKFTLPSNLNKVTSTAVADIEYYASAEGEIILIGPETVVNRIEARQSGTTLVISCRTDENGLYNFPSIRIRVGLPVLTEFTGNGVGRFEADKISANAFTLNLMSVGNVDIKTIEATSVKLNLTGVSSVNIDKVDSTIFDIMSNGTGSTTVKKAVTSALTANQTGTGYISINRLDANKITANQSGTSYISLENCVATTLTAYESGTGYIKLTGFASTAILTADGMGYIDATALKTDRITHKHGDYAKIKL